MERKEEKKRRKFIDKLKTNIFFLTFYQQKIE
jgi:hypothetical protein